jgi:hypothetical protein
MTAIGGYPAPGPQDREPTSPGSSTGPPPTGPPSYAGPPPTGLPVQTSASRQVPMPQIPMLTAHKPGIVPLRPLGLGDILDGAVKAVRFNPKSMVGLSAVVLALVLVPSALLGVGVDHLSAPIFDTLGPEWQGFRGYPAALLQGLTTYLATTILSGLLIYVLGQAVLGRKPDIEQTWRNTRGRIPTLLLLMALALMYGLLCFVLLIGPGVLLVLNSNIGAGTGLLFLGLLGLIVVSLVFSTKISMAAPAIVLEGHGFRAGLRRSFSLTRGSAFWRILGISLLAGLIASFAQALLGFPFTIVSFVVTVVMGPENESTQIVLTLLSHLSGLLTGAVTTPFAAAVTGLLYIDRRMRLEALDVVLLRESQSNPVSTPDHR